MARDHALALGVGRRSAADEDRPGTAVLRLYRWSRPTLSFGRNEPARGRWDPARLENAGVGVVRRPTGGRAVLHDREVTYAVVLPLAAVDGLRRVYRRVNVGLAGGLASLGAPAEIAPGGGARALPPDAGPCFREPAEGEVVARGRKLVGSAQARIGGALLQHGSILLDDDQTRLDLLGAGGAGGAAGGKGGKGGRSEKGSRPATLAGLLGGAPSAEEVEEAVIEGLRRSLGGRWAPADEEEGGATPLEGQRTLEERYRSEAWSWRR